MPMNAFDQLQARGFLYQLTAEAEIRDRLASGPLTFYVGFDPTADSLHVGHLLPVMAMRLLQQAGHRPIAIVGGGTAMVGDPSGKNEARQLLTREQIIANTAALKGQLSRFLDFGPGKALLLDNADWLLNLGYIEFLRDIGKHFSVNKMLTADSVKSRLETGLSFLEFNYMLLQAYDFAVLARDHQCLLQLGGQDQWGNIVAGTDLIRRLHSTQAYGATFPLLLNSQGQKFGKSVAGAIWLDAERTPAFDYYQFWRNVADDEVTRLLGFFTCLPLDEIQRLGALPAPAINRAKEILAWEATALAHGPCGLASGWPAVRLCRHHRCDCHQQRPGARGGAGGGVAAGGTARQRVGRGRAGRGPLAGPRRTGRVQQCGAAPDPGWWRLFRRGTPERSQCQSDARPVSRRYGHHPRRQEVYQAPAPD
jgi:tyrosyl-tRNA synthetase